MLQLAECVLYSLDCSVAFFFFKQKTAYEMRISDWSSDVCSSDLIGEQLIPAFGKLLTFFREEYVPNARDTLAAEAMPGGEAWYRQQIREYTTLDLDPDEIHAIGQIGRAHV